MSDLPTISEMNDISPCDYADALPRSQFMHYSIGPLHQNMGRISGPAFTVKCEAGDHLMLHAAIYAAKPGDIIVAQADDGFALAGGNVCAIAQNRGIAGFVIDGVIRDLAEVRELGFPVFAKGVMPKPGKKESVESMQINIHCGGVSIQPGDIIVADEEGTAVIPQADIAQVYAIAKHRADTDANMTLQQWQSKHHALIQKKLGELK
ncbi:RraA family protein [Glaciecola sp. 2405UD65-10]|jgi:4-hydroxy-4-methyl-2-oxoglutarate aldolase|uniref:RraA family protein n=1 Tax=Glaciecola sp. 2405UD65-10 TaxID=3397244 RepID=UPI003B58E2F9